MAENSAFEKIHVDEREKSNFEGLLEQLNLPPSVVKFVMGNMRMIQVITAVVIVSVVSWALYDAHMEKKIENASWALAEALEETGEEKIAALTRVSSEFKGTNSALWAQINSAYTYAKQGKIEEAIALYRSVREENEKNTVLKPLVAYSLAQLFEKSSQYDKAMTEYEYLKSVDGFEGIGFLGAGRIYEIQKQKDKAIAVYEAYLGILTKPETRFQKALVEEKIVRLKAGT